MLRRLRTCIWLALRARVKYKRFYERLALNGKVERLSTFLLNKNRSYELLHFIHARKASLHVRNRRKIRELKQARRRRQQKPHKFAYLTMKNTIFARFARAYFIFWNFDDVLVLCTTWNDLFCSCVEEVSKRWFQFNSRIVRTHVSSITTLSNWKAIAEPRSYIFRWRSRFRRRRVCLSSLFTRQWKSTFTPLKLTQVIWPQPSTSFSLLSLALTTTGKGQGKGEKLWVKVDLARHKTSACATFCFRVHYFDASTGAGIKRKKKKCAWPCACSYAYVGSFSRRVLVYLHLCLRSCLCKVKTRLYAGTHVKKKKMTLNIIINQKKPRKYWKKIFKQFLPYNQSKTISAMKWKISVVFLIYRFLFHPQNGPFLTILPYYIQPLQNV